MSQYGKDSLESDLRGRSVVDCILYMLNVPGISRHGKEKFLSKILESCCQYILMSPHTYGITYLWFSFPLHAVTYLFSFTMAPSTPIPSFAVHYKMLEEEH